MNSPKFERLALKLVVESPTNPRRTFDEGKLAELADSIREHGVLQPVLVRSKGTGRAKRYELVVGARRYRASKLAGVADIPAIVQDLDDLAVLEVQVIENNQRQDVSPVEEAEGFGRLVNAGFGATEIAKRIGRDRRYVVRRLSLLDLPDTWREAVHAGELLLGPAFRVAALDPAVREEAIAYVDKNLGINSWMSWDRVIEDAIRNASRFLNAVPFSLDDSELDPKAGACSECPKRSSSQPDLFDVGQDKCLDAACWDRKFQVYRDRQLAEIKARGEEVLEKRPARTARVLHDHRQCDEEYARREAELAPDTLLDDDVVDELDKLVVEYRPEDSGAPPKWVQEHGGRMVQVYDADDVADAWAAKGAPEEVVDGIRRQAWALHADDGGGEAKAVGAAPKPELTRAQKLLELSAVVEKVEAVQYQAALADLVLVAVYGASAASLEAVLARRGFAKDKGERSEDAAVRYVELHRKSTDLLEGLLIEFAIVSVAMHWRGGDGGKAWRRVLTALHITPEVA